MMSSPLTIINERVNKPAKWIAEVGDIVVDDVGDMYMIVGNNLYANNFDFNYALIRLTGDLEIFIATDDSINDLINDLYEEYGVDEIIPKKSIAIKIS